MRVVLLWAMLIAYGFAALLGVVSALSFDQAAFQLLATSLILAGAFSVGLLLALFLERGHRGLRWLMALGLVFSGLAAMGWIVLTWGSSGALTSDAAEFIARSSSAFTFGSIWTLYVGYCFAFKILFPWYRILVWCLFACSMWFLFLLETLVIDEDITEFIAETIFGDDDIFLRVTVALIVLFVTGSLALPIIWLISRSVQASDDSVLGKRIEIELTCPRCGFAQELPTKTAHCKQCRLEIRIKIEEPRCVCGFLLYRFEGESCPECGREVPASKRWTSLPT